MQFPGSSAQAFYSLFSFYRQWFSPFVFPFETQCSEVLPKVRDALEDVWLSFYPSSGNPQINGLSTFNGMNQNWKRLTENVHSVEHRLLPQWTGHCVVSILQNDTQTTCSQWAVHGQISVALCTKLASLKEMCCGPRKHIVSDRNSDFSFLWHSDQDLYLDSITGRSFHGIYKIFNRVEVSNWHHDLILIFKWDTCEIASG